MVTLWFGGKVDATCLSSIAIPVITYTIEVLTGNEPGAGTEAQPHIQVFGSRGDTGQRLLYKELTGKKKPFEQGSTGIFEIKAVDLDEIEKITVGHDGHGKGRQQ